MLMAKLKVHERILHIDDRILIADDRILIPDDRLLNADDRRPYAPYVICNISSFTLTLFFLFLKLLNMVTLLSSFCGYDCMFFFF